MASPKKELYLRIHGRVLEHLGIQMYQSPVNAIAELVANAWDADAETVQIELPQRLTEDSVITISDNGLGMTFEDCQNRFLNVGWNRRGNNPDARSPEKGRPILGRKGIGKFAGFGIAGIIQIETISKATGERTIFKLALNELLGEQYMSGEKPIRLITCEPPDDKRRNDHKTIVTLSNLTMKRVHAAETFARSMARRFLLHQQQEDFSINVNGIPLPEALHLEGVEYVFPRDYRDDEKPPSLMEICSDGWGIEMIADDVLINWRFMFHRETIDEEELRGIAVFTKGKLAQRPFLFNITGGLGGQHGVEYLSGQIEADYLDIQDEDLIATERQRINWENEKSAPLLSWGAQRVKELLRVWRERRGEERLKIIEDKLAGFSKRLDRLQPHELRTVNKALRKLAQIDTLSNIQFEDLGDSLLTAWEQGRLRELIDKISLTDELSEEELLHILLEAQVLTALNTAEAVKTKILTVGGLKLRIQRRELETAVRDYIAKNPWLISPDMETFKTESTVRRLLREAAVEAKMTDADWDGRVDLALSSGIQLYILEFMRPGLNLNWDHIDRFERYIRIIKANVEAATGGRFKVVRGYIIADGLLKKAPILAKIKDIENLGMYALDWPTLFEKALASWEEFLQILASRAPEDERLQALLE